MKTFDLAVTFLACFFIGMISSTLFGGVGGAILGILLCAVFAFAWAAYRWDKWSQK